MFYDGRKHSQTEVYDYCENTDCDSRFVQITFKNYVLGYDFYISCFNVSTRYACPPILNMPVFSNQRLGMIITDWYGKELAHLDEVFYPNFSDIGEIESKFKKLANFI